ncbi:MAG: radical SAM protein [Desulfurococcaceae archaeon]
MARFTGRRYATFDVVGAGPRVIAGISEKYGEVEYYTYEKAIRYQKALLGKDIVMISAMSTDLTAAKKISIILRSRGYRGLIIIGGPISFEYQKVLLEIPVDYVVVGEAEIPLGNLLSALQSKNLDPSRIPAIAYRDRSGDVRLSSRHVHTPSEILNSIKPWTHVDKAFDYPCVYRFYVEVVRGCSNYYRPMINIPRHSCIHCFKCRSPVLEERLECPVGIPPGCGFCSVPYMFGPPRSRSVRSIVSEIEELLAHGARRVVLSAPDFLDYGRESLVKGPLTDPCSPPTNLKAVEDLLNSITSLEEVKTGRSVVMIENIKACLVNEEVGNVLGRYLKDTTVHIGLETGCNWFNENILGKPIYLEHVLRASKILRENGLRPYVYLMYDIPYASRKVYVDNINSIHKLAETGVEKITLYKFINLPGTAFSDLKPEPVDIELVNNLRKIVNKYNLAKKRELIGRKIEAWVLETKRGVYAYPVHHGPVILVETPRTKMHLSGCRVLIEITDISPRLVEGRIISVLECPVCPQHGR